MKIFILEDSLNRIETFRRKLAGHDLVIAENAKDAIAVLGNDQVFDIMFLDHDLGGKPPEYYGQDCDIDNPNTGSEVVRWMLANQQSYYPVIIHSLNTVAAHDMKRKLEDIAMECYYIPFSALVSKLDDPNFIKQ